MKTNMLLIFVFCLITNGVLFCEGCDVGTTLVNNFDWNNVRISVLAGFLKQRVFKNAACVYIPFVVPLTNSQYSISDCRFE